MFGPALALRFQPPAEWDSRATSDRFVGFARGPKEPVAFAPLHDLQPNCWQDGRDVETPAAQALTPRDDVGTRTRCRDACGRMVGFVLQAV